MNIHLTVKFGIALGMMTGATGLHGADFANLEWNAPAAPSQELGAAAERLTEAQAHYLTAQALESAGKMREALGHYLNFLHRDAGDPELVAHIAGLTLNYRGLEAAMKLLEDAVKTHTGSPEPWSNLILFCLTHADEGNGLMEKAEAASAQVVKSFPKDLAAYESAVRLHLARNQRDGAAKVLEQAGSQDGGETGFWLGLGRLAEEVWPLADPDNRAAHLAKINAFISKALARAQASADDAALLQVADFYLFSNQLDRASDICASLVQRTGSLDARKRLVRLYEAMERPEDSFKALQDLVRTHPEDVEHRRILANQYIQKRDYARAAAELEAALQAGGGDLHDYVGICKLLRFTENPENFDKFTLRAQQLFPGEPRITFHRALALNQLRKHADAAKLFEEAQKEAGATAAELLDDNFYFSWGVALERSQQFEAAAKQFEKSINLTPSHDPPRAANTMNYLGYMWLEQGVHLDKAEQLIRKANEMEQNNAAFVDSLGWILFKQGKSQEALTELLRAESLMKEFTAEDAEILDHIAQAYDKLGRQEEARSYWRRALDLNPETEAIKERARQALGQPKPASGAPEPSAKE